MIDVSEKDNREMYEVIERSLQDKLNRMEPDDPNRKPLVAEATAVSNIIVNYDRAEQDRLNNNAKNDIEEAKLAIEQRKVELEEKKMNMNWLQWGIGLGYSGYMFCKSFHMEEQGYPFKRLLDWSSKLIANPFGRR